MTGSKYGKQYSVPKEFPSVLKAFTREVLRSQPTDIWEFGAQYFSEMLAQEEAAAATEASAPRRLSPEELRELLDSIFREADVDGSGALSMTEFKVCASPNCLVCVCCSALLLRRGRSAAWFACAAVLCYCAMSAVAVNQQPR